MKTNRHNPLHNEKGLTLIELLGATVILSILILSIVTLTQYNNTSNYRTEIEAEAIRRAESLLNEYRAIVSQADDETAAWRALDKSGVWPDDLRFSYSIHAVPLTDHTDTLQEHDSSVSLPGIILLDHEPWLVTVTVSWEDSHD